MQCSNNHQSQMPYFCLLRLFCCCLLSHFFINESFHLSFHLYIACFVTLLPINPAKVFHVSLELLFILNGRISTLECILSLKWSHLGFVFKTSEFGFPVSLTVKQSQRGKKSKRSKNLS